MAKEKEFRKLMALAKEVLENDTPYFRNRNVIDTLFKLKSDLSYQETVYIRLAIIDSFYSTNMKKHVGGMEELAKAIVNISKDDNDLKKKISQYMKSLNQPYIEGLFETPYGNPSAKAPSLISKYFYFLTEHNFPIEDSLLKENVNKVLEFFGFEFPTHSKNEHKSTLIMDLLGFKPIKGLYSSFDNLVWLYGKLSKNSFSLIIDNVKKKDSTQIKRTASKKLKEFWSFADKITEAYNKNHPSKKITRRLNYGY